MAQLKSWQIKIYRLLPSLFQNIAVSLSGWSKKRRELGGLFKERFPAYIEREYADRTSLERLQMVRLRALLEHAGSKVPYYRKLFAELNFDPQKVNAVSDIRKLPLLTKDTVQARYEEFKSDDHRQRGSFCQSSSGTLGHPFTAMIDHETLVHEKIWIYRHRQRFGYRPFNCWRGTLNGQPIIPIEHASPPYWRVNRPWKQILFSGYHLEERTVASYVEMLKKSGIRYMDGYPSILFVLARLINRAGLSVKLDGVFVGAEPIYESQRDEIERAFGCLVHDYYGLTEKSIGAGDCEAGRRLHLNVEDVVAEIVDYKSGVPVTSSGVEGSLVGTSLVNYSMPLIRYVTGDSTSFVEGDCSCGRGLQRIEQIYTKVEDIIVTSSGKWISPSILTYPFKQIRVYRGVSGSTNRSR